MNDRPWNGQDVGQLCISGIDRLIYNIYSDNILMCLSQKGDFWCKVSHCLQHFVETPVTLQAYFSQKVPGLSSQPLFRTLTPIFCTVRKRFRAFSIETFTDHVKKGHHHFFDLMWTFYVDTNWSNRSTPPICLLWSSKGFDIGPPTRFLNDFNHRWAVLTELHVT